MRFYLHTLFIFGLLVSSAVRGDICEALVSSIWFGHLDVSRLIGVWEDNAVVESVRSLQLPSLYPRLCVFLYIVLYFHSAKMWEVIQCLQFQFYLIQCCVSSLGHLFTTWYQSQVSLWHNNMFFQEAVLAEKMVAVEGLPRKMWYFKF